MKIQDALDLHLKEEASRIIGQPGQHHTAPDFKTPHTNRGVLDVLVNATRVKTFHQIAGRLRVRVRLFATANTPK